MPATPAEVANDLAAQAKFFVKRDDGLARLCAQAARLIRAFAAGDAVEDQDCLDCITKLVDLGVWVEPGPAGESTQIYRSLHRGLRTLEKLRAE